MKSNMFSTKILIVILIIIISSSILNFYMLNVTTTTYDDMLYKETKSVLDLFSVNIEQNIRSIDNISFNLLINEDIQSILKKATNSPYNEHINRETLEELLLKSTQGQKFITSTQIIDYNHNVITSGMLYPKLDYKSLSHISSEGKGQIIWTADENYPNILLLVRDIREVEQLKLNKIGTLIITVDLNKLIKYSSTTTNVKLDNIAINNQFGNIYTSINMQDVDTDIKWEAGRDYSIEIINGQKYFITQNKSNYTEFEFIHFVDYHKTFNEQQTLRKQMIISIALIAGVSIFLSFITTKTITQPVSELCHAMQNVKVKNLQLKLAQRPQHQSNDEIGFLFDKFREMLTRIDVLVNDKLQNEITMMKTKYSLLQSQINPHFLYNTLDSINWMARINKQNEIAQMVKSLAIILRNSIKSNNEQSTVSDEIRLLNNYIYIQQVRFEERLDYAYYVDDTLLSHRIPKLIIQPLIENSIIHGLEHQEEKCTIQLSIKRIDEIIEIVVEDNGTGMTSYQINQILALKTNQKNSGIGLQNIIERLRLLYKESYTFSIDSDLNIGTKITMTIPVEEGVQHD